MAKQEQQKQILDELKELDREIFGDMCGMGQAGLMQCGGGGRVIPKNMHEFYDTWQLFRKREEIVNRLKDLPGKPAIPGRIPWKRTPEDLRALLQALQQGYIANTDIEAIVGHFDIPDSKEPEEMILWKEDQWTIGSLFIALHEAGLIGTSTLSKNGLPRNTPRRAVKHFLKPDGDGWDYIAGTKSFRNNWSKNKTAHASNSITFTKILNNLRIS